MKTDASAEVSRTLVFGMNESGSKYYRIPAICTTKEGTLIAVADKIDDLRFYADAPVEYFNLQGMRVQGKLVPGIYIRRQGSEVTKVLVR